MLNIYLLYFFFIVSTPIAVLFLKRIFLTSILFIILRFFLFWIGSKYALATLCLTPLFIVTSKVPKPSLSILLESLNILYPASCAAYKTFLNRGYFLSMFDLFTFNGPSLPLTLLS